MNTISREGSTKSASSLGSLPKHWLTRKLKYIADVRVSNVDKKSVEGHERVRLCNYVDVYYNNVITSELNLMEATASKSEIERFGLHDGDVVITKDSESWDDIAVPAYVKGPMDGIVCGYHLAIARAKPKILSGEFLFRCFEASAINYQFKIAASGITRYGLGKYSVDNALFPLPPLEEQIAIAAYLKTETARIDGLISRKTRQVEILTEQRAAIISRAVSKGVNPNVDMKSSGFPWLGSIPKHWRSTRFKFVSKRVDVGIAEAATHAYRDEGVPIIRSTNVRSNRLRTEDLLFIDPEFAKKNKSKALFAGDIVTVRTGNAGVSAVIPPHLDKSQCFTLLMSSLRAKQSPEFYCFYFNSEAGKTQFALLGWGTAQINISVPILKNLVVPEVPYEEQLEIVEYINRKTRQIDVLTERINLSIMRLQEFRASLINSAVTGKIDIKTRVN